VFSYSNAGLLFSLFLLGLLLYSTSESAISGISCMSDLLLEDSNLGKEVFPILFFLLGELSISSSSYSSTNIESYFFCENKLLFEFNLLGILISTAGTSKDSEETDPSPN